MKMVVAGAAGNIGRRICAEAHARGHDVLAVVLRPPAPGLLPPGVQHIVANMADSSAARRVSVEAEVVIAATRPPDGAQQVLLLTTTNLLDAAAVTGARLLISGGAATLTVPGSGGVRLLDHPRFLAPAYRAIAEACALQHERCIQHTTAQWTYLSPPAELVPGERTGRFRLGTDELLLDARGVSRISMEDLAVALVDEAESNAHPQQRFTAA